MTQYSSFVLQIILFHFHSHECCYICDLAHSLCFIYTSHTGKYNVMASIAVNKRVKNKLIYVRLSLMFNPILLMFICGTRLHDLLLVGLVND